MIKVVIIDEHPVVRIGVRSMLESDQEIVVIDEFADAETFLRKLEYGITVDIAIFEINLPHTNGYALLRSLQLKYPGIKPIVFSYIKLPDAINFMLSAGAYAYVSKADCSNRLHSVVQKVHQDSSHSLNSRSAKKGNGLTKRELEIAMLLASDAVCPEIADRLNISEKTLQNHRDRIYQKLSVKNRTELTLFVIASGFVNPF